MIRLLKIELFKLLKNKISLVLICAYFMFLLGISILATIKIEIGDLKIYLAEQGIFNFPYIWHLNTFMAAWLKIFFAVVIVSMIGNEYSYNTLKQNLIDGLSKKEFLLSKVYAIATFVLASTVVVSLISLVLGWLYSDFKEWSIILTDLEYLAAYAIKLLGFFSFCLFLGIFIRRSAFALGLLAIWQVVEFILLGLMRWKLPDIIPMLSAEAVYRFFPLNAFSNLIKEPFSRLSAVQTVASQIGEKITKDYSVQIVDMAIALLWTALFIYASYRILKKRDL